MAARYFVWSILALGGLAASPSPVHLTVSTEETSTPYPPAFYGISLDERFHAIEGFMSGQMNQDPALIGDLSPAYKSLNNRIKIAKDTDTPLNSAITTTLKLSAQSGAKGQTGIVNNGWGGFGVGLNFRYYYNSTIYVKGKFNGNMTMSLYSADLDITPYSKSVNVQSVSGKWTRVDFIPGHFSTFPKDGSYKWRVTFDASDLAGGSINIGYPSLFVYKTRNNSPLAFDSPGFLQGIGQFVRFPGAQQLLGRSPENRWKWNETIGPFVTRPGRMGLQGYPSSQTVGLMEFFESTEVYLNYLGGAQPILQVWSGLSVGDSSPPLTGDALQPYVDDVLDELEFCLGDASTPGGSLRAQYGHPKPFSLSKVEIGSMDNLHGGCETYPQRFNQFYSAISQAYPDLTIIASTSHRECLPDDLPAGVMLDWNEPMTEEDLIQGYHEFDNYDRANPIYVSGYTAPQTPASPPTQTVKRAAAEAVFLLGFERNSDVVKMSSYNTTLARGETPGREQVLVEVGPGQYQEMTPEGALFDFSLFGPNKIPAFAKVDSNTKQGPVYWSATFGNRGTNLRVVNYQADSAPIKVTVKSHRCVYYSESGPPNSRNTLDSEALQSKTNHLGVAPSGNTWNFTMTPYETGVLRCLPKGNRK